MKNRLQKGPILAVYLLVVWSKPYTKQFWTFIKEDIWIFRNYAIHIYINSDKRQSVVSRQTSATHKKQQQQQAIERTNSLLVSTASDLKTFWVTNKSRNYIKINQDVLKKPFSGPKVNIVRVILTFSFVHVLSDLI